MTWQPIQPSDQSLTYELADDPRYQVVPEWVYCRDNIFRRRYRPMFSGHSVGEIIPSGNRDAVIAELEAYIKDGGAPVMQDVPDSEQEAEA